MKKLISLVVILFICSASFQDLPILKGWRVPPYTYPTWEPPYTAEQVHTFWDDLGGYDRVNHPFLYCYQVSVKNRSIDYDTLMTIFYDVDSTTWLVDYNDPLDTLYSPFNYGFGEVNIYYDTLGNCTILSRAKSLGSECKSFVQMTKVPMPEYE